MYCIPLYCNDMHYLTAEMTEHKVISCCKSKQIFTAIEQSHALLENLMD